MKDLNDMTQQECNEYSKAEDQSWKDYEKSDLRIALQDPIGEHEWLAHKAGFRDGYEFAHGNGQTQPVINHNRLREQASIAAMQGLLSNPDITDRYETVLSDAAHDAVVAADYLLAELDKQKE